MKWRFPPETQLWLNGRERQLSDQPAHAHIQPAKAAGGRGLLPGHPGHGRLEPSGGPVQTQRGGWVLVCSTHSGILTLPPELVPVGAPPREDGGARNLL